MEFHFDAYSHMLKNAETGAPKNCYLAGKKPPAQLQVLLSAPVAGYGISGIWQRFYFFRIFL